jgi:hypothetical protein
MSSTRITVKDLELVVADLNQTLGLKAGAEGSFCLQGAYGGWQLQRYRGSGMETIIGGYRPKRELYEKIVDIRYGIRLSGTQIVPTN